MAQTQAVQLRNKINDTIIDIMPRTLLTQVVDTAGVTLAEKINEISADLASKVTTEVGKGLSTEDFTSALKTKLEMLLPKEGYDALFQGFNQGLSQGLANINNKFTNIIDGDDDVEGTVAYKIAQAIGGIDLTDIIRINSVIGDTGLLEYVTKSYSEPTVANAIMTINNVALGRTRTHVFDSYGSFVNEIILGSVTESTLDLKIGDNIYIRTVGVPDLWVYNDFGSASDDDYTYISDTQFIQDIADNSGVITVGQYQFALLETEKVDLSVIEGKLNDNTSAINAINNASTGILATTKTYADTKSTNALNNAKSYTDSEIVSKNGALELSLKGYADSAAANAISEANAHTDAFTPFYISATEPADWSKVGIWAHIIE